MENIVLQPKVSWSFYNIRPAVNRMEWNWKWKMRQNTDKIENSTKYRQKNLVTFSIFNFIPSS